MRNAPKQAVSSRTPGARRAWDAQNLAITERLAASDPDNAAWQRDLSVSFEKLGELAVAQGDLAGALGFFSQGLTIAERLAASDPNNAVWQRDLAVSHFKLYQLASSQGDDEALAEEAELWACFEVLAGMKRRGQHLDPWSAELHDQLQERFGLIRASRRSRSTRRHLLVIY